MKRSAKRKRTRSPQRVRVRLEVLQLETRCLLSGLGPLLEAEPNDTLDMAQDLSAVGSESPSVVLGTVGNGAAGAADVDWYRFQLNEASRVHLSITGAVGAPRPVLGLYNANSDPYDFSDPFNPTGHRLLVQTADGIGEGTLDRDLAAGVYYIAVSGSGNRYFHPFLAGSGNDGNTGDYRLVVTAATILRDPNDGPNVLSFDPGDAGALAGSPFVLRLQFDAPIDPGMVSPGANVRLVYSPGSPLGDSYEQEVFFASFNWSAGLSELQLVPIAPLKPGFYQLFLAGDSSNGDFVLLDPNGVPLGADSAHPLGRDYSRTFQVAGIEGRTGAVAGADDTPPFAHDLGELQPETRVQATGAIGDDPYYDPTNPDLVVNPSADVDLYRFHISGPGRYAFAAEVFAGRIGSSADPGVSLFRMDPATGLLVFLDGNNNSRNPVAATNGRLPLHDDPLLCFGLTAGDYYLAVTSNYNTPTAIEGGAPGANGIFDPNVSHSGQNGFSTGPYVLNVGIHRDDEAPEVAATNLTPDETLCAPPTELVVRFTDAMNLRKLFFLAFEQTSQETVSAVFVEGADGARYFPRLESYDDATNEARFLMLDALANGAYQLHLSGPLGLADLAGNPLVGSDASGDYVVSFTVDGPSRGEAGDPLCWEGSLYTGTPQDLGVLFPHELQAGVTIACDFTADPADAGNEVTGMFQFQVLQNQTYVAILSGPDLPAGARLEVMDSAGNLVDCTTPDGRTLQLNSLRPGIYLLCVEGWATSQATQVIYQLRLELLGNSDNPPPLIAGPAPALRLTLVNNTPATTTPGAPQVVIPPSIVNGVDFRAAQSIGTNQLVLAASNNVVSVESSSIAASTSNNVTFPTGALLQLSSGPLSGMVNSSRPAMLASMEREVFRLPDSPTQSAYLAALTSYLLSGPVEFSVPTEAMEGAAAAPSPETLPSLLASVVRSAARYTEWIADRFGAIWNQQPQARLVLPSAQLESSALSTESAVPRTSQPADLQPPPPDGIAPPEGRSTAETRSLAMQDVAGTASWFGALAGCVLLWLARQRKKTPISVALGNRTREAREGNPEEAAL